MEPLGYPIYRRRRGPVYMKGEQPVDNRDVVPYNPYLTKKYDCHINVEYCASIVAVKYLYLYTYKGHDRADVQFQLDEISMHLDSRYVGPAEACWRIFKFPLQEKSHSVERLALHLPDYQQVRFHEGAERQALAEALARDTMLTAWFKLNVSDPQARLGCCGL